METKTQYITINEATKLLDVTSTTLHNWDKSGKLVAQRDPVNGYRLYAVEDISRLVQKTGCVYQVTPSNITTQSTLFPLDEPETLDIRGLRLYENFD